MNWLTSSYHFISILFGVELLERHPWKWKCGKETLLSLKQHDHNLKLTAGYNTSLRFPQLSPFESLSYTWGLLLSVAATAPVATTLQHAIAISYQQAAYRPNSDRARRSASPLVAPRAYISWTRKAGTPSTCARGGSTVAVAAPHPEGPQRWHVPGGICAVVPATTSYG